MPFEAKERRIRNMVQYRARGHYIPTDRDSWITTGWRNTLEEAELDLRVYGSADGIRYSKSWIVSNESRVKNQSPTIH